MKLMNFNMRHAIKTHNIKGHRNDLSRTALKWLTLV